MLGTKYSKWVGMDTAKLKIFLLDQINIGIYGETIKRQRKQHK
jgi:hypothetical protein